MVLGLLVHVTPSIFFSRILRSEALVYKSCFFRTAVLRKLFDIRFSYKRCNFSRVCRLLCQDGVENRHRSRVIPFSCSSEWTFCLYVLISTTVNTKWSHEHVGHVISVHSSHHLQRQRCWCCRNVNLKRFTLFNKSLFFQHTLSVANIVILYFLQLQRARTFMTGLCKYKR